MNCYANCRTTTKLQPFAIHNLLPIINYSSINISHLSADDSDSRVEKLGRKNMSGSILLIGTLDTKGPEYAFVRDLIQARGHRTTVMDTGVAAEPPFSPDIGAAEVAEAGGASLADLRTAGDRGAALTVMGKGAASLAAQAYARGEVDGVLQWWMWPASTESRGRSFPMPRALSAVWWSSR
jgi:hypothetical protein